MEHRRIKKRAARGRADAKAKGVKFGRKPKLTLHQQREALRRRDVDGETLRSIGPATMSASRRFRGWRDT
jgi:DNA invertase Pin-like site-specific DNA recombinase